MRSPSTFKDYVLTRPYGFGRGRKESWDFIAYARGDPQLPDIDCWQELRSYLERSGRAHFVPAARVVWASFQLRRRRGHTPLQTLGVARSAG